MAEVLITYETLFDLLRRERSRNELQDLESTFFDDVKNYLKEKEEMLNTDDKKYTSQAEKEKIQIQIKNARKIIKELYETREKKILHLAASKVKTGSVLIKTSSLFGYEKDLYDDTIQMLQKYKGLTLKDIVPAVVEEPKVEIKPAKVDVESDELKIKLSTNLPKFVGLDQKIYGPFNKGDVVDLPSNVANLLINKGRAETV